MGRIMESYASKQEKLLYFGVKKGADKENFLIKGRKVPIDDFSKLSKWMEQKLPVLEGKLGLSRMNGFAELEESLKNKIFEYYAFAEANGNLDEMKSRTKLRYSLFPKNNIEQMLIFMCDDDQYVFARTNDRHLFFGWEFANPFDEVRTISFKELKRQERLDLEEGITTLMLERWPSFSIFMPADYCVSVKSKSIFDSYRNDLTGEL